MVDSHGCASSRSSQALEQKALAYDSEDGFENFRNCLELEGRRKKRLSRRWVIELVFENDAPAAEKIVLSMRTSF